MLGRPLLVLVILAALSGAPSPVFAAGNDLSAPSVSPTAGSISTVFSFGVRYDGKFDATAVSVQVAGRTLVMHLVAGSPRSGTWQVASTLPAGTWPVTFVAATDRGNPPTLAGPTVTVTGPGTPPPPEPAPSPKRGPAPPSTGQRAAVSSPPATGPGDGSSSGPGVAAPATSEAQTPNAATENAPAASGGSGAPGTVAPTSAAAPSGAPPVGTTGGGPSATEEGAAAPASGIAAKLAGDARKADDGLIFSVLLVGLAGVAAVALVGTAMLLAGRRRDEEDEPARAAPADTPTALERRAVRRAKVRLNDDPIVAAMLGADDKPRRPRRRAGQVASGPGERPRRAGQS